MRWKGIQNLPMYIAGAQVLVYLFNAWDGSIVQSLVFYPPAVWAGEWWRVVTFLLIPPLGNPLAAVLWLYFFYTCGAALENEWGSRSFTFYYLIGALATALAGLFIIGDQGLVPNFFLNSSIFLAFGTLFPNFEILLFFIVPVKVKFVALLTGAYWIYVFIAGGPLARWIIAAAALNYLVFFGREFKDWVRLKIQVARNRRRFK